jgi:organic hydroperoxide reductase OsmC/OhrA
MANSHQYTITTKWTGNQGTGTSGYRNYKRDIDVSATGKQQVIAASADPNYRGDAARYNPEELLVSALSSCHMLWMLHLCADAGIVVTDYVDDAVGTVNVNPDFSGEFSEVVLRPRITITDAARIDDAKALNAKAHAVCFIARSVNFPVRHESTVVAES